MKITVPVLKIARLYIEYSVRTFIVIVTLYFWPQSLIFENIAEHSKE